jgi:hypothetical protein
VTTDHYQQTGQDPVTTTDQQSNSESKKGTGVHPFRKIAGCLAVSGLVLGTLSGLGVASAAPRSPNAARHQAVGLITTTPTITSVTFSSGASLGSSTPLVTINGSGFGNLPNPLPGGDPVVAAGDCGSPAGYAGLDFGNKLYFGDGWEAGFAAAPTGFSINCIGLVIWKYTPTQIQFGFGYVYHSFTPLQNGQSYSLVVKGATHSGTVNFTS